MLLIQSHDDSLDSPKRHRTLWYPDKMAVQAARVGSGQQVAYFVINAVKRDLFNLIYS